MTRKSLLPAIFDRSFFDDARFGNSLGSLLDHSVGFDTMLGRVFDDFLPAVSSVKYPPYNIRKDDDHTRTIEMALAGYGEHDIEVLIEDGHLVIRGNKVSNIDDSSVNYVYKGLAARKFERKFMLTDGAEVTGATLKDGMLNVTGVTQTPDKEEVKRITVNAEAPHVDPTET